VFDSRPEDVRQAEFEEARARALIRLWRLVRAMMPYVAMMFGFIPLLIGVGLLAAESGLGLALRPRRRSRV
jgi:hypothetical protein